MDKKLRNELPGTECFSLDIINEYLDGKLSPDEHQRVEEHLKECELCADAIEGIKMVGDRTTVKSTIEDLNRKIHYRSSHLKTSVINPAFFKVAAIAASIIILLGSYLYLNNYFQDNMENTFSDSFEEPSDKKTDKTKQETPIREEKKQIAQVLEITEEKKDNKAKPVINTKPISGAMLTEKEVIETTIIEDSKGKEDDRDAISDGESIDIIEKGKSSSEPQPTLKDVVPEELAADETTEESTLDAFDLAKTEAKEKSAEKAITYEEDYEPEDVSRAEKFHRKSRTKIGKKIGMPKLASVMKTPQATGGASPPDDAMQKYNDENYTEAIKQFEEILTNEPDNLMILYYAAISYLNVDKPDTAMKYLNKVLEKENNEFYEAAKWYTALAYIKKNDEDSAKILLNQIIDEEGIYKEQAIETLDELK